MQEENVKSSPPEYKCEGGDSLRVTTRLGLIRNLDLGTRMKTQHITSSYKTHQHEDKAGKKIDISDITASR